MCSDSGGSEISFDSEFSIFESRSSQCQRRLIKAITYSDAGLLKMALKRYKREPENIQIDDAKVLHHAIRLAKVQVKYQSI